MWGINLRIGWCGVCNKLEDFVGYVIRGRML